MLPVQTVMIRYMVLVYRWGDGWLSAAGAWSGSLGGTVTGGCARRWAAAAGVIATRTGRAKAPPVWGPVGPFRGELYFDLSSSPLSELSRGSAGSLTRVYFCASSSQESGSKRRAPTGISHSVTS